VAHSFDIARRLNVAKPCMIDRTSRKNAEFGWTSLGATQNHGCIRDRHHRRGGGRGARLTSPGPASHAGGAAGADRPGGRGRAAGRRGAAPADRAVRARSDASCRRAGPLRRAERRGERGVHPRAATEGRAVCGHRRSGGSGRRTPPRRGAGRTARGGGELTKNLLGMGVRTAGRWHQELLQRSRGRHANGVAGGDYDGDGRNAEATPPDPPVQ
jgi:hypothetical protein